MRKKENKQWKEFWVTPCCKSRHWCNVFTSDFSFDDAPIRCEFCKKMFDRELLEKVVRGLNPVTYFCDHCGISAEILSKQANP